MPPLLPPAYRWTPAAQRRFLETLARTGSVEYACRAVSKSRHAAYALRRRPEARAFAVGWDAAILVARGQLGDIVMAAALAPLDYAPVRNACTGRIGWRRADPMLRAGMGVSLLQRLDRSADAACGAGRGEAAHAASQDFNAYLDMIEAGAAADADSL